MEAVVKGGVKEQNVLKISKNKYMEEKELYKITPQQPPILNACVYDI